MRFRLFAFPLAAAALAGLMLLICVLEASQPARAEPAPPVVPPPAAQPAPVLPAKPQSRQQIWPRPKFAGTDANSDASPREPGDKSLALEYIEIALLEAGDGTTYAWHRKDGGLSGLVMPLRSFKDASGNVCRHIVVELTRLSASTRIEGLACRLANGRWQLTG